MGNVPQKCFRYECRNLNDDKNKVVYLNETYCSSKCWDIVCKFRNNCSSCDKTLEFQKVENFSSLELLARSENVKTCCVCQGKICSSCIGFRSCIDFRFTNEYSLAHIYCYPFIKNQLTKRRAIFASLCDESSVPLSLDLQWIILQYE